MACKVCVCPYVQSPCLSRASDIVLPVVALKKYNMKEEIKMARIEVRITINEQTKIKNKANELGLSVSAYMRKTALNHRIIIKTDNEMIRQIRFIGININQIAHQLNMYSDGLIIADAFKQMKEYKEMLQLIIDNIRKK